MADQRQDNLLSKHNDDLQQTGRQAGMTHISGPLHQAMRTIALRCVEAGNRPPDQVLAKYCPELLKPPKPIDT